MYHAEIKMEPVPLALMVTLAGIVLRHVRIIAQMAGVTINMDSVCAQQTCTGRDVSTSAVRTVLVQAVMISQEGAMIV